MEILLDESGLPSFLRVTSTYINNSSIPLFHKYFKIDENYNMLKLSAKCLMPLLSALHIRQVLKFYSPFPHNSLPSFPQ
jgi:hypothetical protein